MTGVCKDYVDVVVNVKNSRPEDYVIASEDHHFVKEFGILVFNYVVMELEF